MSIRATGGMRRWLAVAALASLASCGGGDAGTPVFSEPGPGTSVFGGGGQTGDGQRPAPDPTVQVSTAAVQGQVLNASTGAALVGAAVEFSGLSLTTDTSGFFSEATHPDTSRLVQRAAGSGFEEMYLPNTVVTGVPAVTVFKLTPHGSTGSVAAATGGTVGAGGVGQATFAANSLETSPGTPATGNVPVRLTFVDVAGDTFLVSGDYTSSFSVPLEAFGAAVLSNTAGVQITVGMPAVIRIPVSTRSGSPLATAHLYYLDPVTARWVEDGTATLVGTGASAYYEGNVTRFGQWLVAEALSAPVTVRGCVIDDAGAPVANARIVAEGINYSGAAYGQTNAAGDFAMPVRSNSQLLVTGRRGAILTNAISASTATADVTLSACLTLPSTNAATVRLTWGASPSDIDSHLRVPGGAHVFYSSSGSLTVEPFASLDVDDVTGFGPEITTIRRPKVGIYRFYLHNFSGTFSPGMTQSPTRVELNYAGRTIVFSPPAGEGTNLYWHLFDLEIGSNCSMTLYRYNRWRADEPENPNAGQTAQFCVPS